MNQTTIAPTIAPSVHPTLAGGTVQVQEEARYRYRLGRERYRKRQGTGRGKVQATLDLQRETNIVLMLRRLKTVSRYDKAKAIQSGPHHYRNPALERFSVL